MERLNHHFDRVSKKQTLNSVLTVVILSSITFGMWIPQTLKYSRNGDIGGFYLGVANIIISGIVVLLYSAMLHAVVRRLIAQASKTPDSSPSAANS